MESFTIIAPGALDRAIAAAGEADAKPIAGGTDLLQLMKDFVERPRRLVDLEGLPLDQITVTDDGAHIGALVRMSDLAEHPEFRRHYPLAAEALLASASPQVRNMATIGGNLLQRTRCGYFRDPGFAACNKRSPGSGCAAIVGVNRLHAILGGSEHCVATHASDLAVALAALDAVVELQGGGGNRAVPLTEFYRQPGDTPQHETVMAPGEIITGVRLPPPPAGERSHYLKLRDRASFEFALVSAAVAVVLDGGQIRTARIAMGGVATTPWRLPRVEEALAGVPASPEAIDAAVAHAADGAKTLRQNGFKVPLMRDALRRALLAVTA